MRSVTLLLPLLVFGLVSALADGPISPPPTISSSVEKAIPYLTAEGVAWIEKRGCVSCHQVPAMLWSLSAAESNGFDVDPDQLRKWQRWSTDPTNFVKPAKKDDVDLDEAMSINIDTLNALLLAVDNDPGIDDPGIGVPQWRKTFVDALVKNQDDKGAWRACGQLPAQKRPKNETTQVTVMWTLLSLANAKVDAHDAATAYKIIENEKPESTEWWVARLLLADRTDRGPVAELRARLIERQNDDGGWGWLTGESSDALATGMALYALGRTTSSDDASDDVSDDVRAGAVEFLTSTQRANGSWKVPGTKQSTRGKSTPTSDYWGTAWAVIGLLE